MDKIRKCCRCKIEKLLIEDFHKGQYWCKDCKKDYASNNESLKAYKKNYAKEHAEHIREYLEEYHKTYIPPTKIIDREIMREREKRRYQTRKNDENYQKYHKRWVEENKEKISLQSKIKRLENISYSIVVFAINKRLKLDKVDKLYIDNIINHIELQFEPWMNWHNYKKYNLKKWDDNDASTWTWQIDHIIPDSLFNYNSIEDEGFKISWALDNLTPCSAKKIFLENKNKIINKDRVDRIQEFCKDKNSELLSINYNFEFIKLELKCIVCGHIWNVCSIDKNNCKCKCNGNLKHITTLTISDMHDIAKEREGKCLSNEYINTITKLKWQCKRGHEWFATPSNIKNKRWCPICNKITIEEMKELAISKDGICLSETYDPKLNLKWQCNKCSLIWEASSGAIKGGGWCPKCVHCLKLTIEEMHELAEKNGGKCLSDEYINAITKLKWQCGSCNDIFYYSPASVKSGSWCVKCLKMKNNLLSFEGLKNIAIKKGGKCLSTSFIKMKSKLTWQCGDCNNIWEARGDHVKRGSWCPECAGSFGEKLVRQIFEEIFNKTFPSSKPYFLKCNKRHLQLDGFNEELKLAFEYQGRQHYEFPNHVHKTIDRHNKQVERDRWKKEQCEKNNIKLFIINEFDNLDYNNVKAHIEKLITQREP